MTNKDIIVTGLQSWDIGIGSNCINIAKEFAKNNRVLYVNRALDRISSLTPKKDNKTKNRIKSIQGKAADLRQELPNLCVLDPRVILESVNWMPGFCFNYFNKCNNKKLARVISEASDRLNFKDPVLFVDNDFFRAQYLKEFLKANFFIYYIRDHLINQSYFKKHGARMEKNIIEKADLVVANSSFLASYAEKYNQNAIDIGQGCDFTYFNPDIIYKKPNDIRDNKKPVIGYVGALVSYRLDVSLLEALAVKREDWDWIFVGPEDGVFEKSTLHSLRNVYFLGNKPESELAAYVSFFDVCINPQLDNDATRGNYPRKIDEYLALGKPVVATSTEFMEAFSEFVHLCKGAEGYEKAIIQALSEKNNPGFMAERKKFALSHTWENSVKKIYSSYKALIKYAGNEKIF